MHTLSFMGANFVARELDWSMPRGWGQGVRAAHEWFEPEETFAERFGELLDEVVALGFDTFDLWCAHLEAEWATDERIAAAREAAATRGIRFASYAGGPYGDTPAEFERTCALAAALDIPILGGYSALGDSDPVAAAALLEKYDLRYGRENHPEKTPAEILAKISALPSDRVGVTVDTGWFATQGYDAAAAIRELGDRVEYIHLKDVLAAGAHDTCALGEGIVDIADCLRAVDDIGYTGVLSIEHEPEEGDPRDAVARSRELVERLLSGAAGVA
jgi:sugar phosphate isomerase/epimerase